MCDDEDDRPPTLRGFLAAWASYRRNQLREWWRERVLRQPRPQPKASPTMERVNALMREVYSDDVIARATQRPSLPFAALKKQSLAAVTFAPAAAAARRGCGASVDVEGRRRCSLTHGHEGEHRFQ